MTSVVYWNNIPAPYMVERFNAIARREHLRFEAWFSTRTIHGRSWRVDETNWEFLYRYLPSIGRGPYPLAIPTPLLRGDAPDVFVSLYAAPAFVLGWALARQKGARTALWVEATNDTSVTRRPWKEALKRQIFPRADGILTTGMDGASFARGYRARSERIHHIPHVIDFNRYATQSRISPAQRNRLRNQLGLRGVIFLYVGRLLRGKGLTYLLEAFGLLQRSGVGETSLLLVGDGADEALLRERCREASTDNVVFAGFRDADALPELYGLADVFVFPTLGDTFGLVVDEAMACGLPVISTSAAGEIGDRIEEGVNGFIVPPADVDQLLDRMRLLLQDAVLRRHMGDKSVAKVCDQTPNLWAEEFEKAVERILSMPRVRDEARNAQ